MNYYSYPLLTCQITDNEITLMVKIPTKQTSSQWEIYNFISTPFLNREEICYLHSEPSYVAYDNEKDETRIITGTDLKNCNENTGLCYLTQFEDSTEEFPLCIKNIFLNKPKIELNEICRYRCEKRHKKILLRKISENEYILTNVQENIQIYDKNKNTWEPLTIENQTKLGAIKIKLPCNLELQIKNRTIIPQTIPCFKDNLQNTKYHRIIPVQWTDFDSLTIDKLSTGTSHFKNITNIFKENWKETTPNFEVKTTTKDLEKRLNLLELKEIPPGLFENAFLGDLIYTFWLTTISIIIILQSLTILKLYIKSKVGPPIPPRIIQIKKTESDD